MYLRLSGYWFWEWAVGVCIVVGQIVVGLHYLPMNPIVFGLILLGPVYALTSLAGLKEENQPGRMLVVEPGINVICYLGISFSI